ncbi:LacI family transcriptional regulator [Curtobacterium sp. PhB25]|uniref:LacI family DNA-binding transcriptional regulator n=1 Tax=unclassified Curtobacterium TaxID=257496 RepID=UPI00104907BA|nr:MULTISPECIES: LacI family DNA-binding transcriptional regulator [unclassified Curtobacterium]TCU85447.1 LacI family transcriptional regulator [Curtobacterium sp. PhB191]TDW46965.1 LacI family transcriptional regulator [Curtobacterium sp. PhB42]TDW57289.1 LacI family transcriptional regulator [Curtobacterium sp. PhB190]TDW71971.1 LacI family transcriptional regulator [Curtobacterium sp. PhB25]
MTLERTGADRSTQPVRITDVAALAGVSIGTASKALNGTGQLRDSTRARVKDAAEKLGFVGDARARALSSGRTYTVGMITTDSFGRFSIPVLLGAEDALSAGQMAVLLCDTRDDHVREAHYLRSLAARGVDGIIVTGRSADPRPPIDVAIPVVYAFTPSTSADDVSITLDDSAGSALVASHVLTLGRQRVAVVTGPARHRSAERRVAGAASVLGSRLVTPPLFGEWSERWGRQAVDVLARQSPEVDAIVCGSDQIARGVCDRLRELGRSVPEDVAVTGYDDWDVMALASRPPLTTVDLRLEELGRVAGQALLGLIDGGAAASATVTPSLVIRESTAGA